MNTVNMPGFTAEASLSKTGGHYQALHAAHAGSAELLSDTVIPAIPACKNCDEILERCEANGWHPRAVCNACLSGYCYEKPPMPDPHANPFDPWLPPFSG